jgi:hypothetical protein
MWEDLGIDILGILSASSNANAFKQKWVYKDFDINADYSQVSNDRLRDPAIQYSVQWGEMKLKGYHSQDTNKKRDASNNINLNQLEHLIRNSPKCYICQEPFTATNPPTLDRIDNSIGHTHKNVKACCEPCNTLKSDGNVNIVRDIVQRRKFCLLNNLPMPITDEVTYKILRVAVTGGISNVGHRINIAGLTHIIRLELVKYADGTIHVFSVDTQNVMTHITGCDFSSLYPPVFSSNEHPFIPYTGHKMYMPGYQTARLSKENSTFDEMLEIIKNPDRFECQDEGIIAKVPWIVACVKGHIDEKYLNDNIIFAPIIKKSAQNHN